jgi:FSR family fosmidomycin resistance protein-like MFS transporter
LVAAFGLRGTAWGLIPGVLGSLILLKLVPAPAGQPVEAHATPSASKEPLPSLPMSPLLNLWAISILRGMVTVSFLTFLPVLFASRGVALQVGGQLVTVFLLAGAIGGVLGGFASERFGTKPVMGVTLALASPVLLGAIWTTGALQAIALFTGGILLVASHPVNVSLAQSLVPHRAGTAAAFMIGVAIGISGLLMPVVGAAADAYGVEVVLAVMAFGSILASILVIPLPAAVPREVKVTHSEI